MGTSGSYGGSSSSAWSQARQRLAAVDPNPAEQTPAAAGEPGLEPEPGDAGGGAAGAADNDAAVAAAAIASALMRDEPALRAPRPPSYSMPDLLPRQRGGGGGRRQGVTRAAGRMGTHSRRRTTRNIQRGAAAIAAGYALRNRDRDGLHDLGLDLEELEGLGPRQQCDRILRAVLGDEGHPDEHALRRAALEQVKTMIMNSEPPSVQDVIKDFIANFVMEQGLVELRAQRSAGLDPAEVAAKEGRVRRWIRARVRHIRVPGVGRMSVRQIIDTAASIAQAAMRLIVAGARGR